MKVTKYNPKITLVTLNRIPFAVPSPLYLIWPCHCWRRMLTHIIHSSNDNSHLAHTLDIISVFIYFWRIIFHIFCCCDIWYEIWRTQHKIRLVYHDISISVNIFWVWNQKKKKRMHNFNDTIRRHLITIRTNLNMKQWNWKSKRVKNKIGTEQISAEQKITESGLSFQMKFKYSTNISYEFIEWQTKTRWTTAMYQNYFATISSSSNNKLKYKKQKDARGNNI